MEVYSVRTLSSKPRLRGLPRRLARQVSQKLCGGLGSEGAVFTSNGRSPAPPERRGRVRGRVDLAELRDRDVCGVGVRSQCDAVPRVGDRRRERRRRHARRSTSVRAGSTPLSLAGTGRSAREPVESPRPVSAVRRRAQHHAHEDDCPRAEGRQPEVEYRGHSTPLALSDGSGPSRRPARARCRPRSRRGPRPARCAGPPRATRGGDPTRSSPDTPRRSDPGR